MTTILASVGTSWRPCGSGPRSEQLTLLGSKPLAADSSAGTQVVQSWPHGLRMSADHPARASRYGTAIRPRGAPPV
jgi:hypothetical protein